MQMKIFTDCQFSDKLSLLERKLCLLTGRRKFKRTGMKETVKTKWKLRMQERKNSKRLFTKLVHSLIFFICGQDMLSFNLLLSWTLLSGWVSSFFCREGEDFCSSPVCWQVCFPESMEWKSSPQLLAGGPHGMVLLAHLLFFHRLFQYLHGKVFPKPLLLWNSWLLAWHQENIHSVFP